jgi:hypothetical protein
LSLDTNDTAQLDFIDVDGTRFLLDRLLSDARLYRTTEAYRDLMQFVARLRNFAPFNAMLLNIQMPGLSYAASAADWAIQFGRRPKQGGRPLLIMWPFSPVALAYDVLDTEGRALPEDVETFFARGEIDGDKLNKITRLLSKNNIEPYAVDAGDRRAGLFEVMKRPDAPSQRTAYRMTLNRNHPPVTSFVTIAHELAHLFLGHRGPDKKLNVPARQ